MIQSLFHWLRYFPYRCKSRLAARRLGALGVDFSSEVDRRFSTSVGHIYQPTYYPIFEDGIRNLPISIQEIKLFDVGSGKGAVFHFAKQRGIEKVGGVELSDELCAIAAKNMRTLGYQDVDIFQKDATLLKEELDAYNVFYMSNPFPAVPMRGFLRAIVESTQRTPRSVYLVYHVPTCAETCREEGFVVLKELMTPTYFRNDKPTLIMEYRATQ
jgi:predicted RNA methylase